MQERNRIPLRARIAAIVALGGAAALAACGGKSEGGVKTTPTQPANSPVATETIAPTPTTKPTEAPTLEPTPTPEPIPTQEAISDAEISEKIDMVTDLVNQLADAYPGAELLSTIEADVQTARADYTNVIETKNYPSILTPLNGFGNVGFHIGLFACNNAEGGLEGKVWSNIKELVLVVSQKYENVGNIEPGITQTFKDAFFKVPEGCTNPIMLSSQ